MTSTEEDLKEVIAKAVKAKGNMIVVCAFEYGSRAIGLSNAKSDHDVHVIFVRSASQYLVLDGEKRPDAELPTIEIEGLMDLSGWCVSKALKLFRDGNPCVVESFHPRNRAIFHISNQKFIDSSWQLVRQHLSPSSLAHHYLAGAKKHLKLFFTNSSSLTVCSNKKYVYVLRPLFCIAFIYQAFGCKDSVSELETEMKTDVEKYVPPLNIFILLNEITPTLHKVIKTYSEPHYPLLELQLSKIVELFKSLQAEGPKNDYPKEKIIGIFIDDMKKFAENFVSQLRVIQDSLPMPPNAPFNSLCASTILEFNTLFQ